MANGTWWGKLGIDCVRTRLVPGSRTSRESSITLGGRLQAAGGKFPAAILADGGSRVMSVLLLAVLTQSDSTTT